MALRYLLDENVSGVLFHAIARHNLRTAWWPLDVIRVGDLPELPLGIADPAILLWTEQANRIFVSRDLRTMPNHLDAHLATGHRCPGVFLLRPGRITDVLDFLVCASYASESAEWENRITFIP